MADRKNPLGIFDPPEEEPSAKAPRYLLGSLAVALAIFLVLWYPLGRRFHKERSTVQRFMNELVAGDMTSAYRTWKPSPSYSFADFLEDWGPTPYYGAIKSYEIDSIQGIEGGSGAAVTLSVSPYAPFPRADDPAERQRTRTITLWVDSKDESISFPPCGVGPNPRPCW